MLQQTSLAWPYLGGHYMAKSDVREQPNEERLPASSRASSDDPLDSGLRRKFLAYCEENPGAEECRLYEV
jgi:hypothetical protein